MFGRKKSDKLNLAKVPKHVAFNIGGVTKWAEKENTSLPDAFRKSFGIVENIIKLQTKLNIPILTVFILPETSKKNQQFSILLDSFIQFLDKISFGEIINKEKIKVTVLGKWYDLPGRAVEHIKGVLEETAEYDNFFLNFCVNYNGQTEVLDACKLIARQVQAKKLDINKITKSTIKDNIYSSYFIPPNVIIKNGTRKEQSSFLLWDSIHSHLYFSDKLFPDTSTSDITKAIKEYQKH